MTTRHEAPCCNVTIWKCVKKKKEKKTGPLVDSCMPGGTQKPNGKRNCEKKEREGIQEIDAERLIKFFLN